jgi:hypothetical protein
MSRMSLYRTCRRSGPRSPIGTQTPMRIGADYPHGARVIVDDE